MSRSLLTYLGTTVAVLLGITAGATGAAWYKRDQRSEPWRNMRVDHEGVIGASTRTRVIFDNPKVPLQGIEVFRNPQGAPELAHIELRAGAELTLHYDRGRQPSSLHAPDGSHAQFAYNSSKVRVLFLDADGATLGEDVVLLPVAQQQSLQASYGSAEGSRTALARWVSNLVPAAHAQEAPKKKDDPPVTVKREVPLMLDISIAGKDAKPGKAQVEVSCAPFACVARPAAVAVPGSAPIRIAVSAGTVRSKIKAEPTAATLAPYKTVVAQERQAALKVMPDVQAAMAIAGATARACADLKLTLPLCGARLSRASTVAAALHSVGTHTIPKQGVAADARATTLFYEEAGRAALDRPAKLEVCLNREGFSPACTTLSGNPFGAKPMPYVRRKMALRRGIEGTLVGSFELLQSDGRDCNFSPSPKTEGPLRLTFDNKTGTVTAKINATGRGTRAGLRCSLGTGDMRWTQTYSATLTQTLSPEQLQSGGSVALRLVGTMSGTGSASQSNCRTAGGASAACPGGRSNSYSYPIEMTGNMDLSAQTGNGKLLVRKSPLQTYGLWRVPAKGKP